jgi:predicted DNA-binding protein
MTTVRLDIKTEVALKRLTARRGQTKSEVIRDAIDHLLEEEEKQTSAYDRLQPFIGIIEEGDPKLSENTGKRFRELLESRQSALGIP